MADACMYSVGAVIDIQRSYGVVYRTICIFGGYVSMDLVIDQWLLV